MMAIAVLFLIPTYYLAKSKGYNVALILVASAIISMGVPIIINILNNEDLMSSGIEIAFPLLALVTVWLLPEKNGAPGKKYLKITFECPECKNEITFPRSAEGLAELCPKCEEIITVPLDEFSPKPIEHVKEKPAIASGLVCFASFGNEMSALQLQAELEDNGIETQLIGGTGGGSLPQIGAAEGFKIAIDIDDWDRAIEIEKIANQSPEEIP